MEAVHVLLSPAGNGRNIGKRFSFRQLVRGCGKDYMLAQTKCKMNIYNLWLSTVIISFGPDSGLD
jgi:hypothetical protein